MKLLLDTHIWLWNHLEPWRVSSEVNQAIGDPANELWLSPVSIWELVTLVEKKRVSIDEDVNVNVLVQRSKEELLLKEASLSWAVAEELLFTSLAHKDPADRFLVATARVYDLTLVTADERLTNIEGLKVLANR